MLKWKTLGSNYTSPSCRVMWHDHSYMHVSFRWMVATIPWVYYMWSFSLLDGCNHTLGLIWSFLLDGCAHNLDPFTWSSFGWMHPYHDSSIRYFSDVCVSMLACRFSGGSLQFHASTRKAFQPLLLFDLHALGVICFTTFCHCPCTPHSLILEDLYSEPHMKNMSVHPSSPLEHFPLSSFPKNLPSNQVFKINASSQFFPYADLQSLKLGLALNDTSDPFITSINPLLASF